MTDRPEDLTRYDHALVLFWLPEGPKAVAPTGPGAVVPTGDSIRFVPDSTGTIQPLSVGVLRSDVLWIDGTWFRDVAEMESDGDLPVGGAAYLQDYVRTIEARPREVRS